MLFIFNELRTATAAATSDKLGEILLREGLITHDQLKKALLEQKNTGMRLGYTLVKLGFAEEYTLRNAIEKYYQQSDAQLQSLLKDIEDAEELEVVGQDVDEDVKAQDLADDAPVVKLINGLLTDAVKRGASDVHIEPFEHE